MSEQQMSEYVIYGTADSIALDEVGIQYFIVNLRILLLRMGSTQSLYDQRILRMVSNPFQYYSTTLTLKRDAYFRTKCGKNEQR